MFDTQISASVRQVKGTVKDDGDHVVRRIRLQFERQFSPDVSRGLGSSAEVALKELEDRGLEKVVMPIGALKAALVLEASKKTGQAKSDTLKIAEATGIKAVAVVHKAGGRDETDGDAHPIIRLEFECQYTDEVWVFLGRHLRDQVGLTITKNQLDLDLPPASGGAKASGSSPPPATNGKKGGAGAKGTKGKRISASEWEDDPQQAATPQEAEEIRARQRGGDPEPFVYSDGVPVQ